MVFGDKALKEKIKLRSLGWALVQHHWYSCKNWEFKHRHAHRENVICSGYHDKMPQTNGLNNGNVFHHSSEGGETKIKALADSGSFWLAVSCLLAESTCVLFASHQSHHVTSFNLKIISIKSPSLMTVALEFRATVQSLAYVMKMQTEDRGHQPESKAPATDLCPHHFIGLASRTVRKHSVLLKPPRLWYFVMEALTNSYTTQSHLILPRLSHSSVETAPLAKTGYSHCGTQLKSEIPHFNIQPLTVHLCSSSSVSLLLLSHGTCFIIFQDLQNMYYFVLYVKHWMLIY